MKRIKKSKKKEVGLDRQTLGMQMTRKEWIEFFKKKDFIQSREETAKELGCSKYILRKIAEEVGIVKKQGRESLKSKKLFKDS